MTNMPIVKDIIELIESFLFLIVAMAKINPNIYKIPNTISRSIINAKRKPNTK